MYDCSNDQTSVLSWQKVARKATAFPPWRATESRWDRNVVSLVSSATELMKVARKATAFPPWRATESRWDRNMVSLVSSATELMKVARKATAFPPWRATESRWDGNMISLVSSATELMHRRPGEMPAADSSCLHSRWWQERHDCWLDPLYFISYYYPHQYCYVVVLWVYIRWVCCCCPEVWIFLWSTWSLITTFLLAPKTTYTEWVEPLAQVRPSVSQFNHLFL